MGEYLESVGWTDRFTREQTHLVKLTLWFSAHDIADQGRIATTHYDWCRSDECNGYWMNVQRYIYETNAEIMTQRAIGYEEFWMFSDPASAIAFKMRFG